MIKVNTKVIDVIELIMKDLEQGGISFDEALQGLREMNIQNQKVMKVILTAIGRAYTK